MTEILFKSARLRSRLAQAAAWSPWPVWMAARVVCWLLPAPRTVALGQDEVVRIGEALLSGLRGGRLDPAQAEAWRVLVASCAKGMGS